MVSIAPSMSASVIRETLIGILQRVRMALNSKSKGSSSAAHGGLKEDMERV
jgi:hypothetical protein